MLGIMHHERDGSPAFVFDMMEPERPKVDRAVLGFLRVEALHPALNSELARNVAGLLSPTISLDQSCAPARI